MTPKLWYEKTIGKSYDIDGCYDVQCWDYFAYFHKVEDLRYMNIHCSITGYAGDIWKLRNVNGASKYFIFITNVNDLRDGDWCFWNKHVAYYYNGKEVGQNQYGRKYVSSIPFEKNGFIGAFRYKYWSYDKGVAELYTPNFNHWYYTTDALNLRTGGSVDYPIIITLPAHYPVKCYGYYHMEKGTAWLYVSVEYKGQNYIGFVCGTYLKEG